MRLYFLDLGTLDMDRTVIMPASPPGERIRLPVPGYLIRADDGATILVDTGMGRDVLAGEVDFGGRMFPVDSAGAYVVDRLAALGLRPDDITTVVATHFHFDHAGGLADFPGATIVAQRAAVEAARAGARKVQDLARETGATLVYGHDAAQWQTLRHAPEYYE